MKPDSRNRWMLGIGPVILLFSSAAFGQSGNRLTFEVASVKPCTTRGEGAGTLRPAPGGERYVATCVPLRPIITTAYWIRDDQVVGGPGWLDSDSYDINGVAAQPSSILDLHSMMQNLLVQRFNLQMHHETREMQAYILTVDKGGARNLKSHPPQYASDLKVVSTRDGLHEKLSLTSTPVDYLAWLLSARVNSAVVNQTGLQGAFDFDFAYTDEPSLRPPGATPQDTAVLDTSGPTLAEALRDRLGLKLEARKAPVDFLIIDHAERPSAN